MPQGLDRHRDQAVGSQAVAPTTEQRGADAGVADVQLGCLDEARRLTGGEVHQPRQRVEGGDPGQVAHVTLRHRGDVISVPARPTPLGRASQGWREAAGHDPRLERRARPDERSDREGAGEQPVKEGRGRPFEFGLGEREEAQHAHAARERIGEAWHGEDVRGAREEEAAGSALADARSASSPKVTYVRPDASPTSRTSVQPTPWRGP